MNSKKWICLTLALAVLFGTITTQAQSAALGWDGQTGIVDEDTGERLPGATVELVQDDDGDPYRWTLAAGKIAYLEKGWLPGIDHPIGQGYRFAFRIPMPAYAEFDVELVAECMSGMTYEGMLGEEYGFGVATDEEQYLVFYPCVSFGDQAFADQREIRIWVQWSMDTYEEYTITVSDQVELLPKDYAGMTTTTASTTAATTASTTTTAVSSAMLETSKEKTTTQDTTRPAVTTKDTTAGTTAETTAHSTGFTSSTVISSTTTAATTEASTQLPEVTVSTAKTEKTTAQTKKTTTVVQTEPQRSTPSVGQRDIVDLLSAHAPIVQVAYMPRLAAAAYREGAIDAADPVNGVELNVHSAGTEERTAFAQENNLAQVSAYWDVSLSERNGAKMALNEQAIIALPLDDALYALLQNDRAAYRFYHQEEDGTLTVLPFAVIRTPNGEGYLLFRASDFSPFALVKEESAKTDNPKTADNIPATLFGLLGCLALCGGMLCKKRCVF